MLIDKPELALEMNLRRVQMGGWSQERYMALNRAGDNAIASGKGFEEAKKHWLAAYEMDPNRVSFKPGPACGHIVYHTRL